MSLDIWLMATIPTEVCDMNYTHNITDMWRLAGVYDALYMSDGKAAMNILPALQKGIKHMEENPDDYKKLNPSNGWGDYDSALPWLIRFYEKCKKYPEAIIGVSK